MSDVFKRQPIDLKHPITADMCLIEWGNILTTATNLQLVYQQPVTRRRTLGTNGKSTAVIYAAQPLGSISIARLFADGVENIFDRDGWSNCGNLATIRINFTGDSSQEGCDTKGGIYTALGCIVTSYSLSAEAEGLTVIDNVSIEFLQLEYSAA